MIQTEKVAAFLEFACWDHHVHGKGDHRRCDLAAGRLLAQHPEIARDSIYTAVVCGELEYVKSRVAETRDAALLPGGPHGWTPLLYLCYARFTYRPTIENALPIARVLLDAGANPNDFYMAESARYSALVGAAGEGEQDSPRQPQGAALFQLLLERGAEPFDIQVLYNTHFSGDVLWWLELIHSHTAGTARAAEWDDPEWKMLDMGGYGTGARFLADLAEQKGNQRLTDWLVAHGANPTSTAKAPRRIATRDPFAAAAFRLDRAEASRLLSARPDYLRSTEALFAAAARDRADVVAFLLDLGVPLEIEDASKQRTLHAAAGANAVNVVKLLIERGAEIDPREDRFHAAPIGFAAHSNHVGVMDLLAPRSREVFNLCAGGYVDRIRELLREEPALARSSGGFTSLLFWLPEPEPRAKELVELLLANGADPDVRDASGRTAADSAERRGMLDVAARLREVETDGPSATNARIETFDSLAHDLVLAYDSGFEPALKRLGDHFGNTLTWDEVRAQVRSRLSAIPNEELPDGYFAIPQARLLLARAAGFKTWKEFEES